MIRRHRGPVTWVNEEDGVPESGFYALTKNGKELTTPLKRLVAVQHRVTGQHHYRAAKPDEHSPPVGNIIEFESALEGKTTVDAP